MSCVLYYYIIIILFIYFIYLYYSSKYIYKNNDVICSVGRYTNINRAKTRVVRYPKWITGLYMDYTWINGLMDKLPMD